LASDHVKPLYGDGGGGGDAVVVVLVGSQKDSYAETILGCCQHVKAEIVDLQAAYHRHQSQCKCNCNNCNVLTDYCEIVQA